MRLVVNEVPDAEAIHVLKVTALCGLVLAAYAPIPWSFTALMAVLTGRAMVARTQLARSAVLYLAAVWIATLGPVVLLGNPDVIRTGVVAATLVLLVRPVPGKATLGLSVALQLAGLAAAGAPPHTGALGDLEFALGATWPRDWGDVSSSAGLFLLGSAWGKARNRAVSTSAAQGL